MTTDKLKNIVRYLLRKRSLPRSVKLLTLIHYKIDFPPDCSRESKTLQQKPLENSKVFLCLLCTSRLL